jgi:hypothetical protein
MKKIMSISIVVLLSINIFQIYSCNEKNKTSDKPIRSRIGGYPPQAVTGIWSILEGDHSDYTPIDTLDGLIEDSLAIKMSELYASNLNKSKITVGRGLKTDDTRSVWFSLSTLKAFIDEIDRSIPVSDKRPKLGIRVYFGIYPALKEYKNYQSLTDLNPIMTQSRQSVFFVPCYMDSTDHTKYIDFNYNYVGNPDYPTPYSKLLDSGIKTKSASLVPGFNKRDFIYQASPTNPPSVMYKDGESIENHGGMVPPPAGSGTFPTPSGN